MTAATRNNHWTNLSTELYSGAASAWAVTLSDLLLLLLTFFALRLSMSSMSDSAAIRTKDNASPASVKEDVSPLVSSQSSISSFGAKQQWDELVSSISLASSYAAKADVSVADKPGGDGSAGYALPFFQTEDALRIRLYSKGIVNPEDFSLRNHAILQGIAAALRRYPARIAIEAHYADGGGEIPYSDWGVSESWAVAIARQMIDAGLPENLLYLTAYGDSRPHTQSSSLAQETLNSRIEIVIFKEGPV